VPGSSNHPPATSFLSISPASLSPIVLTCEHATHRLPFAAKLDREQRAILDAHWGWDLGAWRITRELARGIGAGAVGGRWSRLWLDLNRRVEDPTLIRRQAEGIELSWNRRLGRTEIDRRIATIHAPYHAEVDRQIARRLVRGIRPLLLAVHTFTPTLDGRPRPFDIGVLFEHHEREARHLGRAMHRRGLRVRYNQPYSGMQGMMYSIDRHGTHHRLPCLELEVNQALSRRVTSQLIGVLLAALRETVDPAGRLARRAPHTQID
jgi:predicted N-formylglutamate amidohydrolase